MIFSSSSLLNIVAYRNILVSWAPLIYVRFLCISLAKKITDILPDVYIVYVKKTFEYEEKSILQELEIN